MPRVLSLTIGLLLIAQSASAQFSINLVHEDQLFGGAGQPNITDMLAVDFDDNGTLDIVMYSATEDVLGIALGNGDATFQPITLHPVGISTIPASFDVRGHIGVSDFDGDGLPDIAVMHDQTDTYAIVPSNGTGGIGTPVLQSTVSDASHLRVADVNEDGFDDVLISSLGGFDFSLHAGNGTLTLDVPTTINGGLTSGAQIKHFELVDVDNDDNLDIVVPYVLDETDVPVNQAAIFTGDGTGGFSGGPATIFVETAVAGSPFVEPSFLHLTDLNDDDVLDIVTAQLANEQVGVVPGSLTGFMPAMEQMTNHFTYVEVFSADLDFDGNQDLITLADGPMSFQVLLGDGAFGFTLEPVTMLPTSAAGVFAGLAEDFNGDGKPEIAIGTHYTGALVIYENTTPGTVGTPFVRGDANADGGFDVGDAIAILGSLFTTGPLVCLDAGDSNDDGLADISDAIHVLSALFVAGAPAPFAPHPDCGLDPTPDSLDCDSFPACP